MKGNLAEIDVDSATLILIDMQEKLVSVMPQDIDSTIAKQKILLQAASLLGMGVIVNEQYPKGLGHTVTELSELFLPQWPLIEKTTFSSMGHPDVHSELKKRSPKTVVLAGIEAHVCVLQTAIDCINAGYHTILLTDATNSRSVVDRDTGIQTVQAAGGIIMTVESILFMLMRDSRHPAFKGISKLLV